jgi:hypothetical protein
MLASLPPVPSIVAIWFIDGNASQAILAQRAVRGLRLPKTPYDRIQFANVSDLASQGRFTGQRIRIYDLVKEQSICGDCYYDYFF